MTTNFSDRIDELKRYFPKPFYNLKNGQGISILLEVKGSQLNQGSDQIKNMREQFLLSKAVGDNLDLHGVNLDVFRPRGYNMPDNVYRELIKIVTNSSKNIERVFERILYLYFGPNAITDGIANVYSYRPNEMVVEIQQNALIIASSRDLYGTWYLHLDHGAYDGDSIDLYTGTLSSFLPMGSTSMTLASVPTGMPLAGFISFGPAIGPDETKQYVRSGLVVTFLSPTRKDHNALKAFTGPKFPDDYPSGFCYDTETRTDLVGSYLPGATAITAGAVNQENFPLQGVAYIGDPLNSNFEAKGYTKPSESSTAWTLDGPLSFPHSSGDPITLPNMPRMIKTTLQQAITAGSSYSEISVTSGADFPLVQHAIKFAQSFENEEMAPFVSRKISDNTKLLIDPAYVFTRDHSIGEKVQLMARKTRPSTDGLNWCAYLNDTDSLRFQFFNLLRRLKATGVKIVFELL